MGLNALYEELQRLFHGSPNKQTNQPTPLSLELKLAVSTHLSWFGRSVGTSSSSKRARSFSDPLLGGTREGVPEVGLGGTWSEFASVFFHVRAELQFSLEVCSAEVASIRSLG